MKDILTDEQLRLIILEHPDRLTRSEALSVLLLRVTISAMRINTDVLPSADAQVMQ